MMKLYTNTGKEITQDLTPFGPAPEGAIGLKFADPISDAEWITDEARLTQLKRENAPLAYVTNPVVDEEA